MTLSVANAETQFNYAVRAHASLVAQYRAKYLTIESDLISNVAGDYAIEAVAALNTYRGTLNNLCSKASVKQLLTPRIRELAKAVGAPANVGIEEQFKYIKAYYGNTPRVLQSRDITFDVSFSVSGTGTGQLIRLVKDKYGANIENVHVENKTCECISDQMDLGPSGRHNEKFKMKGQPLVESDSINDILYTASGKDGVADIVTVGLEGGVLKNGNLTSKLATGTVSTMFSNWTLDSTTGVEVDLTNVHIANYGQTPVSAKISAATRSFTQRLPKLDPNIPYLPILAYNRQAGSAPAGTQITYAWGSKSQTLTLGGAETGVNYFIVDRDADLWPDNFYEDQADVVISVPTLASGYLNITMFTLAPMTKIDGTWWALIPGGTPFEKLDNFGTIGDSYTGSDSIVQRYLVYGFNEYLNHSGTPDWAEPSLP